MMQNFEYKIYIFRLCCKSLLFIFLMSALVTIMFCQKYRLFQACIVWKSIISGNNYGDWYMEYVKQLILPAPIYRPLWRKSRSAVISQCAHLYCKAKCVKYFTYFAVKYFVALITNHKILYSHKNSIQQTLFFQTVVFIQIFLNHRPFSFLC